MCSIGPAFDSTIDTIVRVEASKLRKRLEAYYRGPGRNDGVIITIPKGTYVPGFRYRARRSPGNTRAEEIGPVSVAALPFRHITNDPEEAPWSDGLTTEVISLLSSSARLRVVSAAPTPTRENGSARSAYRSRGVRLLVQGTVRRRGERVRVMAHVTEVPTGSHIWSTRFDREFEDAWIVQEQIAREIVDGVLLAIADHEGRAAGRRHTNNIHAFDLYVQGCSMLARFNVRSQREALDSFERASAAEPDYPLSLLGIARVIEFIHARRRVSSGRPSPGQSRAAACPLSRSGIRRGALLAGRRHRSTRLEIGPRWRSTINWRCD